MKIVYMHHAERDKNEDDNITERGIRHISLFSEMAKDVKFDAIFSSVHLRCRRTADIVNQYHNLEIIEDERFNEKRKDEDFRSFLERNMEAIDDIVKAYSDDSLILCVTSGVNISAFICYAYNVSVSNDLDYIQACDISPVIFNIKKR